MTRRSVICAIAFAAVAMAVFGVAIAQQPVPNATCLTIGTWTCEANGNRYCQSLPGCPTTPARCVNWGASHCHRTCVF